MVAWHTAIIVGKAEAGGSQVGYWLGQFAKSSCHKSKIQRKRVVRGVTQHFLGSFFRKLLFVTTQMILKSIIPPQNNTERQVLHDLTFM